MGHRERILLVDDEPQVLVALEDLLGDKFTVFKSDSALQALEMVERERDVAVVITDQRMPEMNGDEFLAKLSTTSRARQIMVTGYADLSAVIRAVNSGQLFAYVTKPWEPEAFRLTVDRAAEHFRLSNELAYERRLLHDVMDNSPDGIYFKDRELRFLRANRAYALAIGREDPDLLIGKPLGEVLNGDIGELEVDAEERKVLSGHPSLDVVREYRRSGSSRWFSETKAPIRGDKGKIQGLVGIAREVTPRVVAEQALRESERQQREQATILHAILDGMADGVVATDADGMFLMFNARAERILGAGPSNVRPEEWAATYGLFLQDEQTPLPLEENPLVLAIREGVSSTAEVVVRNGVVKRARVAITATPLGHEGERPMGGIALLRDITEQRRLEAELSHSQRMEAIGLLAGGVAHDFNNLLAVIQSYGQLVLEDLPEADPKREDVGEMLEATRRATALTRQLLAFSRRSMIQPQTIDLNEVVSNIQKMLRRIIGEDVELVTHLEPSLGPIQADPGQVEQVILNLAVNSRDAMPTGGQLSIETANVESGTDSVRRPDASGGFVVLRVGDSGMGMDGETMDRIFEPFFTTKEVGKGTGLGLSTVYGIVQQSGGEIRVKSELGKGTVFDVYFPRVQSTVKSNVVRLVRQEKGEVHGTILVVEDDDAVRQVAARILKDCGYVVHVARRASDARRIAKEHAIDLLLTDVIMPEVTGPKLAEELTASSPRLKVLFMSGYTAGSLAGDGSHPPAGYLEKPFSPRSLADRVAQVLKGDG